MDGVKVLKAIHPIFRESLIYMRLGYQKTRARISQSQEMFMRSQITTAQSLCNITVGYRVMDIRSAAEGLVMLEDGTKWESKDISIFLKESPKAVLMFSTAGRDIMNAISEETSKGNMEKAVVYDAAASVIVDAGLDWLMDYINRNYINKGMALTKRRYSPGYGDFVLENQLSFLALLDMKKYDINLTKRFTLEPEKSVTAVAGFG